VKPNRPNTSSESKIFAKLKGLSIVGKYIAQDPTIDITQLQQSQKNIDKSIIDFLSTNPSLIKGDAGERGERGDKGDKGDKGDNGIADARIITITVCTSSGPEQIEVYAPQGSPEPNETGAPDQPD
jgi:hypothetical protein